MSSAVSCRLAAAALVVIAGRDAGAFAQAQFSSDVSALAPGRWQWSAWLDAKGRVRNVFALLMLDAQRLLAWLPLGDAGAMAAALSRFVLRSKVEVRAPSDWHVLVGSQPTPPPGDFESAHEAAAFALAAAPGQRVVLARDATHAVDDDGHSRNALQLAAIGAGLPWLAAEFDGEFVAPALDLGRIGATSLGKGCYPGQEIVARLHYRGGNKRHLRHLVVEAVAPPPVCGEAIGVEGDGAATAIGRVLYAATANDGMRHALAVIDEGRAADAGLSMASGARVVHDDGFPNLAR